MCGSALAGNVLRVVAQIATLLSGTRRRLFLLAAALAGIAALLAALLTRLLLLAGTLRAALLLALLTRVLRGLVLLARAVLPILLDVGTLSLVVIHDFLLLRERARNISRQQ